MNFEHPTPRENLRHKNIKLGVNKTTRMPCKNGVPKRVYDESHTLLLQLKSQHNALCLEFTCLLSHNYLKRTSLGHLLRRERDKVNTLWHIEGINRLMGCITA